MNIMPDTSLYTYIPNWSWIDTQTEDFSNGAIIS